MTAISNDIPPLEVEGLKRSLADLRDDAKRLRLHTSSRPSTRGTRRRSRPGAAFAPRGLAGIGPRSSTPPQGGRISTFSTSTTRICSRYAVTRASPLCASSGEPVRKGGRATLRPRPDPLTERGAGDAGSHRHDREADVAKIETWRIRTAFAHGVLDVGGRPIFLDALDVWASSCFPTRSASSWRTFCGPRTASSVTSAGVEVVIGAGRERTAFERDLVHPRRASSCRTSRACPRRRPRRHARRDARPGRRPARINPLLPAELVIDHSVQVDEYATPRDPPQHRARVRAQPRALRVPALGAERVRQLPGRPAEHRASSTR